MSNYLIICILSALVVALTAVVSIDTCYVTITDANGYKHILTGVNSNE